MDIQDLQDNSGTRKILKHCWPPDLDDFGEIHAPVILIDYRNKAWAETLKDYIESHLGQKITTEQLAVAVGCSASFVAHHFESEFGRTPRQYILERRMAEARSMLESGSSVLGTADRLGFYDAFHFSKTFKHFWKKSPICFRATVFPS